MPQPPMGNGIDDRGTPIELFRRLDAEYNFTLDGAASHANALVNRYCTLDGTFEKMGRGWYRVSLHDGLDFQWGTRERVYLNPPYGRGLLEPFVRKAATCGAEIVVALLPVRTEQEWFHKYVLEPRAEIEWIRGRLKFDGLATAAPFPSMLVTWR